MYNNIGNSRCRMLSLIAVNNTGAVYCVIWDNIIIGLDHDFLHNANIKNTMNRKILHHVE